MGTRSRRSGIAVAHTHFLAMRKPTPISKAMSRMFLPSAFRIWTLSNIAYRDRSCVRRLRYRSSAIA